MALQLDFLGHQQRLELGANNRGRSVSVRHASELRKTKRCPTTTSVPDYRLLSSNDVMDDFTMKKRTYSSRGTVSSKSLPDSKRSLFKERMGSHILGKRVRVNVSGQIFETFEKTLQSKEESIFNKSYCIKHYDFTKDEYYFDRNSKAFEAILTYFQCGILVAPPIIPPKIFVEELQFFGFETIARQYYEKHVFTTFDPPNFGSFKEIGSRLYLWHVMEYPTSSALARAVAVFSSAIIVLSIFIFCTETLPMVRENSAYSASVRASLRDMETFCVAWFSLELLVRVVTTPNLFQFAKSPLNMIDVIAVLPFFIALLFSSKTDMATFALLRVIRLVRVFRIFKLSRYSKAIQLLLMTLISSTRELILLASLILITLILFASAIYFLEHNELDNGFESIPHTFWMGIVTVTTVGYGDLVPSTFGGRLVSSILAVTGVLVVALPIPIIVNNFNQYYQQIMSDEALHRFRYDTSKSRAAEKADSTYIVQQLVTTC